jgi:hypothetical protein
MAIFSKLNRQNTLVENHYLSINFTGFNVGIIGELYPQEKDFVDGHLNSIIGYYDADTKEHEYGQLTVDLVISALKNFPDFSVRQTPMNSVADIVLKWDLLLEINSLIYPIQVKSDMASAINAYNTYDEQIIDHMEKRIEFETQIWGSNINRVRINPHTDDIYKEEQIEKIEQKYHINKITDQYEESKPLYIWSSHEPENISKIMDTFADTFKLNVDLTSIKNKSILEYQAKKKIFDDKKKISDNEVKSLRENIRREGINRATERRRKRIDQKAEQTCEGGYQLKAGRHEIDPYVL